MSREDDGIAALRRITVLVVLGLLVFVVVVDVLDSVLGPNAFSIDAGFYGLVFGVIGGLFGARAVELWRHRSNGE